MAVLRLVVRLLLLGVAALTVVILGAHQVHITPDLILIAVTAIALVAGPMIGALWGLIAGWLVDLTPPGAVVLGLSALLYAAVGAVLGRLRRADGATLPWMLLAVGAGAALVALARVVLALADGAPVRLGDVAARWAVTVTFGAVLVPLLIRLEHRLTPRRER